ncbi:hypothetical protein [Pseudonocardia alaniniphila]|uniref:Uncharacterized protein n=1 Tax=Pseudonocardia alaniniphila TaxID=75291 RepID=A0ABS9T9W8_9PSEU|nr:hypothetical protein [Pseudonocardia alaniniphila]MCH6165312.1 hypothetical protein [Pseudonocardia alaniniphila]
MTTPGREAKNARDRARRKAAKADVSAEIEILYKPLDQWDDEELARGRPRDPDGQFRRGPRPKWLTAALQAERLRRAREMLAYDLASLASDAQQVLHSTLTNQEVDDSGKPVVPFSVKVDVAKYVYDQFMGKARTSVDVTTHNPLEDLLGSILVNPDGEASHTATIIEGEVVDPSELDDVPEHLRHPT